MTARAHHRTLVAQLQEWTPEQVAELLVRRPDLAHPRPPLNVADLAQHAQFRPSIDAALAGLTLPENRLLQVVVSLRADVPLGELAASLPEGVGLDDIDETLSSLEAAALVWRHGGRLHSSGTLHQSMPTSLGPPLHLLAKDQTVDFLRAGLIRLRAELKDAGFTGTLPPRASGPDGRPPRKAELVEELSALLAAPGVVKAVLAAGLPEAAAMALAMAESRPLVVVEHSLYYSSYRSSSYAGSYPSVWLFHRALLLPVGDGRHAAQPREVGVSLRGGRPVSDLALERPVLAVAQVEAAEVDAHAGARAVQTLDRVADLLEHWSHTPVKALKSGGLGATAMKQTAAALDVDPEQAACLVELAYLAGLLEITTTDRKERRTWVRESFVGTAPAASAWVGQSIPARGRQLATAWLRAEHWPSTSGRRDSDTKAPPVLSPQYAVGAPELRRRVLDTLASLDPGSATTAETLARAVHWNCPQPWLGLGREAVGVVIGWVAAEAELLGMAADGALSSFGLAVLAGKPAQAEKALAASRPEPSTTFTLQADLTATVVGALERGVLAELRLLADVESTGAATALRFSDASLRRALDAGRHGDEILTFLEAHATKGVPKPLAYLVADVARRYGHLQVAGAGSFVTSDDPAVLADACSHRRTRKLSLRLLAPTVAASPHPGAKVLAGLREAGFLPVAADDGDVEAKAEGAGAAVSPISLGPRGRPVAGPTATAVDLPEPFRARVRGRPRDVSPLEPAAAARLAAAILAGPPDEPVAPGPSDQGKAAAAAAMATAEALAAGARPPVLPLAFPHDPYLERDDDPFDVFDGFDDDDDTDWPDAVHGDHAELDHVGRDAAPQTPDAIGELLEWAFDHERVLGLRLGDADHLAEPILLAVTAWAPGRIQGIDITDGSTVSILAEHIGTVVDLGPLDELANVSLLGPPPRSARRHGGRGRGR